MAPLIFGDFVMGLEKIYYVNVKFHLRNLISFSPFSADPLSNMLLQFDTKEEAIGFAVRNGKLAMRLTLICALTCVWLVQGGHMKWSSQRNQK